MITLATLTTRSEAEALRMLLAEHGISALVFADDQGGMYPAVSFIQGVELRVAERDFHRAKELLENFEQS